MNVRPKARDHHYAARLTWTGAAGGPARDYAGYSREYRVEFAGKPALRGSADPSFRGDATLHNPEDLLVASLSACHMLTYLALCALAGIVVAAYEDDAVGTISETARTGRFTRVLLRPRVTIDAGDPERALALHERANADCFIAASVNFPVAHESVVVVREVPA